MSVRGVYRRVGVWAIEVASRCILLGRHADTPTRSPHTRPRPHSHSICIYSRALSHSMSYAKTGSCIN